MIKTSILAPDTIAPLSLLKIAVIFEYEIASLSAGKINSLLVPPKKIGT